MKLPNFFFKNIETPQWPQFPSCSNQPKTSSFRATATDILNTLNPSSLIINSPQSSSLSENTPDELYSVANVVNTEECIENVILGLKSTQRLFFNPDETKSLLEQASQTVAATTVSATVNSTTFQDKTVVCSMDSINPYLDFKKSMEDMIKAHKLSRNWDFLEELLCWYLKVNEKENHVHIISAFVDLVLGFSIRLTSTASCSSCSPSSPLSYTCSSNTINSSSTSCD